MHASFYVTVCWFLMVSIIPIMKFTQNTDFYAKLEPNSLYALPSLILFALDFCSIGIVWYFVSKLAYKNIVTKYICDCVFAAVMFMIQFLSFYDLENSIELHDLINRYSMTAHNWRIAPLFLWENRVEGQPEIPNNEANS